MALLCLLTPVTPSIRHPGPPAGSDHSRIGDKSRRRGVIGLRGTALHRSAERRRMTAADCVPHIATPNENTNHRNTIPQRDALSLEMTPRVCSDSGRDVGEVPLGGINLMNHVVGELPPCRNVCTCSPANFSRAVSNHGC